MKVKDLGKLAISILVSLAAGGVGTIFTVGNIPTWYATLARPSFAPPNWVFGPVWTALYILMGIVLFLVWRRSGLRSRQVFLFAVQLVLNALWSIIFFGAHLLGLALVEIVLLWLAIVVTMISFYKFSRTAAWLLAPYLAWVSFATVLNAAFYFLN